LVRHWRSEKTLRTINKQLWLLLSLVLIVAMIHFLVASQAVALVFFFLPTLYAAYHFGRRYATLTACASVCGVVLLTYVNPSMLNHRMDSMPVDSRWFDVTVWGGVLVVTAYAMGTLYERNQKSLQELKNGYEGMLVILQQFLVNQKNSEADSFRVSSCANKIAEALGLDPASSEDLRTAALLRNVNEIGISNEILYKAANLSQDELEKGMRKGESGATRAVARNRRQSCGSADRSADPQSGGKIRLASERTRRRKIDYRSSSRTDHKRFCRRLRFDDSGRLRESLRTKIPGRGAVERTILKGGAFPSMRLCALRIIPSTFPPRGISTLR